MTTSRFFVSQKIPEGASAVTLTDARVAHQIKNVLRTKPGSEIVLLDGSGYEYLCLISDLSRTEIELDVVEKKLNENEPKNVVTLYQSIIKKDKMEWVFEKCTEIGVSAFVPVLSEHSVKLGVNGERARKILQEAAEQSRRGKLPTLSDIVPLPEALKQAAGHKGALNVLAHNKEGLPHLKDVCAEKAAAAINIFIGPEGGFSEAELAAARAGKVTLASLSQRTLRSETAAVAASLFAVL